MKLYHGTSGPALDGILTKGIHPRGKNGRSNWKNTVESNPNCVYLSEGYALHFAIHAANTIGGPQCGIVEVDTDKLVWLDLLPDEDAIEQTNRGHDDLSPTWDMKRRTRYYRKRMGNYAGQWDVSLKALGTCCYQGVVPVSAITRVAAINLKDNAPLRFACDPTISLLNYKIMGGYYRQLNNYVFGDAIDEADLHMPYYGENLRKMPRDGITINVLNTKELV